MALSDTRDYVLAIESNKQVASEIAKSSAQSKLRIRSNQVCLLSLKNSKIDRQH